MRFLRSYIRVVDEVNYRIGRIAMYGLFAMMAILLQLQNSGWSILLWLDGIPVFLATFGL